MSQWFLISCIISVLWKDVNLHDAVLYNSYQFQLVVSLRWLVHYIELFTFSSLIHYTNHHIKWFWWWLIQYYHYHHNITVFPYFIWWLVKVHLNCIILLPTLTTTSLLTCTICDPSCRSAPSCHHLRISTH